MVCEFKNRVIGEIETGPFLIYSDEQGDLYIKDRDWGLTFVRSSADAGKFNLEVIIEENEGYLQCADGTIPNLPYGGELLVEITQEQWRSLVKEYLYHKRLGVDAMKNWLDKKIYMPIKIELYNQTLVAESMPPPDASEAACQEFHEWFEREFASLEQGEKNEDSMRQI